MTYIHKHKSGVGATADHFINDCIRPPLCPFVCNSAPHYCVEPCPAAPQAKAEGNFLFEGKYLLQYAEAPLQPIAHISISFFTIAVRESGGEEGD